jgi:vanZ/RDD domain protein
MLRGLFITSYFYLIPDGLLFLTNEFNKTPDSMLFLALFPIMFAALILLFIITVVLMLMNKRFLFDRLSGSFYKSAVQNEQSAVIDTVETQAETQAETEKDI